jgi:peptidyl-prolyl cis-trans isomerase SurA
MYRWIGIALLCGGPFLLYGQESKSPALFTLAGEETTEGEFLYAFRKNHTAEADFTEKNVNDYLQLFINFKLKVQEARARGLDTAKAYLSELNSYKDELKKPYLPSEHSLDFLVKETYDRLTEEVRASHILIRVAENAGPADTAKAYTRISEIRSKIHSPAEFGLAAREYSEDPSARVNSGDLGYFTAMQMVYKFESAAYSTPVGQVSAPVRTRFGYHLIHVTDRAPARGEVEVSHLLIRTSQTRTEKEARNLVFEIHDQLKGGVDWDETVSKYSDDPGTRSAGGRLQPFGVGQMARVPEFEQAAFSLQTPGDISDPVASPYGWHIIRLERKIPLPPFKEMEPALRRQVARNERYQLSRETHLTELKKRYNLREDSSSLARLLAAADSSLLKGNWNPPGDEAFLSGRLFDLNDRAYTNRQFISFVKRNQSPSPGSPSDRMKSLYQNYVVECVLAEEEGEIIRKNPDFAYLLAEYREGLLLFEIMETEVWNKASIDTVGQKKYFDNHAAEYQWKERAEVRMYSFATREERQSALEILGSADSVKKSAVVPQDGLFERGANATVDATPWTAGRHLVEAKGKFNIVDILRIHPSGPKSFEQARASVIADYQDELERRWVESLRGKYKVTINNKTKRHALGQLVRKT